MRRISVLLSVVIAMVIGLAVVARGGLVTLAQDATPTAGDGAALAGHPLVGAWLLADVEGPDDPPSLVVFTSDGVYQQADYDGTDGYGAWEATGASSAMLTFVQQFPGDEGEFGGAVTIRATIEVDPDGQRFTASYTLELTGGEGAPSGEFGPGNVVATRIAVEPMGTPVGSIEQIFGQFEEGTPAAGTPAP